MTIATDKDNLTVSATDHPAHHNELATAVNTLMAGTLTPPVTIDSAATANTSLALRNNAGGSYLLRLINATYGVGNGPGVWLDDAGVLRIDNSGAGPSNILILTAAGLLTAKDGLLSSGATSGVGYATGAGGVVTQGAGSGKATGVTLAKVCGQITLNNAALAAGAKVSFVVTNSTVAATDLITVNVVSGGTANAYRAAVTAVASTSFTVTVENITAGSLSESPVVGFAVIKGVTS